MTKMHFFERSDLATATIKEVWKGNKCKFYAYEPCGSVAGAPEVFASYEGAVKFLWNQGFRPKG